MRFVAAQWDRGALPRCEADTPSDLGFIKFTIGDISREIITKCKHYFKAVTLLLLEFMYSAIYKRKGICDRSRPAVVCGIITGHNMASDLLFCPQ